MGLGDGIKRKQEEDYNKAANTAEEYWANLDVALMNRTEQESELVSALALAAIAAELRAARKEIK